MDWMAQRELDDEYGGRFGDPRTCPRHGCVTSSADGMFDAPCGACEAEMDETYAVSEPLPPLDLNPPLPELRVWRREPDLF